MPASQKDALLLSTPESADLVHLPAALDLRAPLYESLLNAFRNLSHHCREEIAGAIAVVEIEELTRATLEKIATTLDNPETVRNWNLNKYNLERLQDPGEDLTTPDAYFRRHGSTKSRVILRVAAKEVLHKVKQLPHPQRDKLITIYDSLSLHRQINDFVRRYDQRIELGTQPDSAEVQREKRQQEPEPGRSELNKRPYRRRNRQAETLSYEETLPQSRLPTMAAMPFAINHTRHDEIHHLQQSLPSISSLQEQTGNNQPYHSKPPRPILQQTSPQINNLIYPPINPHGPPGPALEQTRFQERQWLPYSNSEPAQDQNVNMRPEEQQANLQQQFPNDAAGDFNAEIMSGWEDPGLVEDFIGIFEYR